MTEPEQKPEGKGFGVNRQTQVFASNIQVVHSRRDTEFLPALKLAKMEEKAKEKEKETERVTEADKGAVVQPNRRTQYLPRAVVENATLAKGVAEPKATPSTSDQLEKLIAPHATSVVQKRAAPPQVGPLGLHVPVIIFLSGMGTCVLMNMYFIYNLSFRLVEVEGTIKGKTPAVDQQDPQELQAKTKALEERLQLMEREAEVGKKFNQINTFQMRNLERSMKMMAERMPIGGSPSPAIEDPPPKEPPVIKRRPSPP